MPSFLEAKIISCTGSYGSCSSVIIKPFWQKIHCFLSCIPDLQSILSDTDTDTISKSGTNCGIATFLKLVRWQRHTMYQSRIKIVNVTRTSVLLRNSVLFCTDYQSFKVNNKRLSSFVELKNPDSLIRCSKYFEPQFWLDLSFKVALVKIRTWWPSNTVRLFQCIGYNCYCLVMPLQYKVKSRNAIRKSQYLQ